MNRTFALLLVLAVLLAHTLAIHKTEANLVAAPYDVAHVAFRIGRNAVHEGRFAWDASSALGSESYPSWLWLGACTAVQRVYGSVSTFSQTVGLLSALATVLVLARFSPGRLAGIIAPLLLVVSGGMAAAAASGTETSTFALLIISSFLAYERGRPRTLAVVLSLALLTRPEAIAFAVTLAIMEGARRGEENRVGMKAFALPAAVVVGMVLVRSGWTGHAFSPWMRGVTDPEEGQLARGLAYVGDFLRASGGPILFAFPLWYLGRRALGPTGTRACVLTLVWFGIVALGGGGALPFFEAMVPVLPVLYVAVQAAMTVALDSRRAFLPQLTWALFGLGLATSALASKYPGDLGPLPVEHWHRAWMEPSTTPRFGYRGSLGRMGLAEEIQVTERLRAIGLFLRDNLDPDYTILSPWPGAIGYLSRLKVADALGRTTKAAGMDQLRSWTGQPRVDVVATLDTQPDYIVPLVRFGRTAPTIEDVSAAWAQSLDLEPEDPRRAETILERLETYELVTVPVPRQNVRPGTFRSGHFFLLRRLDLALSPTLEANLKEGVLTVEVTHAAHEQLVDLRVQIEDVEGRVWTLRPTGEAAPRADALARSSILLHPTGTRTIELLSIELPDAIEARRIEARLRTPGARDDTLFASVGRPVVIDVR